jgi:CRISPR-associated protein Cmr5
MKKRIEEYIPRALEALKTANIVVNGAFNSEFGGYIAAFGPSVIQSGLLPTVAFYSCKDACLAKDRQKIGVAILRIISQDSKESLLDYINNRTEETKQEVLDAVIALKLALRTFKKNEIEEGATT